MTDQEHDDAMLGPYELKGELGCGAMARVWRAWDPNLEREVAIKEPLIDENLPENIREEIGRRFVQEAKTAAKLNHPNIVCIHAADVYDGRPAIVMELVEGSTLGDILENGPMEHEAAVSVLDQLLDGIGYAHEKGVVHRDLKPDNIFIAEDGTVKIGDFGIAHLEDSEATKATQAGAVLGTPGYMSPEQAKGTAVDGRSDLFSVGTIGYEMFTGNNPFGSADSTTMLYRIVHEPPAALPDAFELTEGVQTAIFKALEKDPDGRPQTASDMKSALHGGKLPDTPSSKVAIKKKKDTWIPYAAVAGVCALGIGILLFVSTANGANSNAIVQPITDTQAVATEAPDIVGFSESDAKSKLSLENLEGSREGEVYSAVVEAGLIIEQQPIAGASINEGDTVKYVVSKGPEPAPAPSSTQKAPSAALDNSSKSKSSSSSSSSSSNSSSSSSNSKSYSSSNSSGSTSKSYKSSNSGSSSSSSSSSASRSGYMTVSVSDYDCSLQVPNEFSEKNHGSDYKTLSNSSGSASIEFIFTSDCTKRYGNLSGPKDLFEKLSKNHKVSYNAVEDNWFVLSYAESGKIRYIKGYVEGKKVCLFDFTYPESEKEKYDSAVEVMVDSFNPGSLAKK